MSENMPQTLADVKAGDEVVMIYRTGRVTHNRSDDRVVRAVVTDAKRVNLTIVEQNVQQPRKWTIRRDTGTDSTPQQMRHQAGGGIYGWKAYTVAQHEHNERRSAADRTLRRHRIDVGHGSPWYGREVELADLLTQYVEQAHSRARLFDWGIDEEKGRTS